MGVAVADADNDGDQDLYVTNYGPNALYHNRGTPSLPAAVASRLPNGVPALLFSTATTMVRSICTWSIISILP